MKFSTALIISILASCAQNFVQVLTIPIDSLELEVTDIDDSLDFLYLRSDYFKLRDFSAHEIVAELEKRFSTQ
ncbi:hypothetical protein CVT24_001312 [Panaeolus cyanescens]|uniref:Uncharacterized protein n=1 Tax=Panaeolus cyanescens TaxID=181874 RepID=A0A409YYZ1_9AGAR|nr:hypothetical protein CVT24_001312 [Panaeolus cyanescens]